MNAIKQTTAGTLAALALTLFVAGPVAACGPDENMTHMGVVAALDPAAHTLTLVDAATGKHLTFVVTDAQLTRVAPKDRVVIRYAEENGALVAEEITA
jgi:hypothetical protein